MAEELFESLEIEHRRLYTTPFGLDEQGDEIRQVNGQLIRAVIEYMFDFIAQRVTQACSDLSRAEIGSKVSEAQTEALDKLVVLLNAAMPDERFRVSQEYLLKEGNYYSYEFEYLANYYARAICGDPDFFFNKASKSIPTSIAWIGRPFTLQQVYALLPRLTAKFVDSDIRVVQTTSNSAVIQWYVRSQAEKVPEPHRAGYIELGCRGYQGAYARIPGILNPGLPMAQINETTCQVQGDECCTWEVTWQNPQPRRLRWLWLGLLGTVGLFAYSLSDLPAAQVSAWLALVPLLTAWFVPRLRRLQYENEIKTQQVLEQRDMAEAHYDEIQKAHSNLQIINIQLETKVSELTALHRRVQDVSGELSAAAAEILTATTQQASGATEQSAAISQTTSTVELVRDISEQAIAQSEEVAGWAQEGVEFSQAGRQVVQKTIAGLDSIKERMVDITKKTMALSEQTRQIGQIIATVNEIAAQSNLLALNAAVEAARAGEHGKGFSVVAGEVRSLAQQSRAATNRVKSILGEIQSAIGATETALVEGQQAVDQGESIVLRMEGVVAHLVELIKDSAQMAVQVRAGGHKQAAGIEQVTRAMQAILQSTEQSLLNLRQVEGAARKLNDLACQLTEIVHDVSGTGAAAVP
jgi:methyl-accepting chemotaxis protein